MKIEDLIVGKKYKHKNGNFAFYAGLNEFGFPAFELEEHVGTTITIPKNYKYVASNTYWGYTGLEREFSPLEEESINLVNGEIYHLDYGNGNQLYIFRKSQGSNENSCNAFIRYGGTIGLDPEFNTSGNMGETGVFRKATDEEAKWLLACVKANKFIPKEEALKSLEVKELSKEELLAEAKRWYPIGTKFKSVYNSEGPSSEVEVVNTDFSYENSYLDNYGYVIQNTKTGGWLYSSVKGWARIISKPETKTDHRYKFNVGEEFIVNFDSIDSPQHYQLGDTVAVIDRSETPYFSCLSSDKAYYRWKNLLTNKEFHTTENCTFTSNLKKIIEEKSTMQGELSSQDYKPGDYLIDINHDANGSIYVIGLFKEYTDSAKTRVKCDWYHKTDTDRMLYTTSHPTSCTRKATLQEISENTPHKGITVNNPIIDVLTLGNKPIVFLEPSPSFWRDPFYHYGIDPFSEVKQDKHLDIEHQDPVIVKSSKNKKSKLVIIN